MLREKFQEQLEELKTMVQDLGDLASSALNKSIEALVEQDVNKALEIMDADYKINDLEEEINEKAIVMIAKQQPVAIDLRRIIAAIKISTDIERIGDLAVNISKSIIRIGNDPFIKPLVDIPNMASIAQKMTSDVIKAFYEEDVQLAKEVAETDDKIDEMYGELVQELLTLMAEKPEIINQVTQLSFVCRYLERVGDHVTNISESIIYLVKGKRFDLD